MDYDIGKINQFIQTLEGNDYEKHCHDYHKLFAKQKGKYENIINQLIGANDEKALQQAISINEFYQQQADAYRDFLANKDDYYSYVNMIQLKADEFNVTMKKTAQPKQYTKK